TDIDGNPLAARQFTPTTPEDKRLSQHAATLRELRTKYRPMPLVEPLRDESQYPMN
ncbi:MAG: acyl-CoA thioesterase, partial [Corynebacterium glyciniphilum]|nr:acyl-CoA thioesterase [Corynebacterium glyciniphilum]